MVLSARNKDYEDALIRLETLSQFQEMLEKELYNTKATIQKIKDNIDSVLYGSLSIQKLDGGEVAITTNSNRKGEE